MGRKGKSQKHTAKEIAGKHKAAKEKNGAAGGGGKAAKARKTAGAKAAVKCKICLSQQPNLKSMEAHFDSKHSKLDWKNVECPKYESEFGATKSALKKEAFDSKQKKDRGGKLTAGGNLKTSSGKGKKKG